MLEKLFTAILGILFLFSGQALESADLPQGHIDMLLTARHYHELGVLLQKSVKSSADLRTLSSLPAVAADPFLMRAIHASCEFADSAAGREVKLGSFLQIALFFEAELEAFCKEHGYYVPKKLTGFDYALEYDPTLKSRFIILEGRDAFIGEGKKKRVTKAIQYGLPSRMVARQEQTIPMEREFLVTKLLHGQEGIFETLGFGQHDASGKHYTTIYAYLYNAGSLQKVFDDGVKFSCREKMKMALDILKGLAAIHSRGLVHKDMGARNYLVDIPKGKKGNRDVKAVIADLGRTDSIQNVSQDKPQGNTSYTAPEGLYKRHLEGADYYKTDIYAVGLVLYHLFHDRMASWQSNEWVKETSSPLRHRYRELVWRIRTSTEDRRVRLAAKSGSGRIPPVDRFELLILRMLNVQPSPRGSALELCQEMESIYNDERGAHIS